MREIFFCYKNIVTKLYILLLIGNIWGNVYFIYIGDIRGNKMFSALMPFNNASLVYPSLRSCVSSVSGAFPCMSIFSSGIQPISSPTPYMFSYIPSFAAIGNYFMNMFSNFSLSSFLSNFSFTLPHFNFSTRRIASTSFSASSSSGGQRVAVSGSNQNMSFWQRLGYNAEKGLKLAKDAARHVTGFIGKCARYVKNAISRCGLGAYTSGHGYQMVDTLRNNKNFKQISPDGVDLKKLPAGCILVYGRGVSGYSSTYGHAEITTGTGKAVSDGVTNNLRKPTAIFIPV